MPRPMPVAMPVPQPAEVAFIEREVPVVVEHPIIETVETIVEQAPPEPIPVMVKTIHDKTIIQEPPTDIHKVELKKASAPARSTPPVRSSVTQPKGWFKWWYLLPLLCCLPLLCLPCLLCCPRKKYADSEVQKLTRPGDVAQKDLVSKEPTKFNREKVPVRKGYT